MSARERAGEHGQADAADSEIAGTLATTESSAITDTGMCTGEGSVCEPPNSVPKSHVGKGAVNGREHKDDKPAGSNSGKHVQ